MTTPQGPAPAVADPADSPPRPPAAATPELQWVAALARRINALDLLIAVVTVAAAGVLSNFGEYGLTGELAAGVVGGLALVRRIWPVPVLVLSALILSVANLSVGYGPGPGWVILPITAVYVTSVLAGQLLWAIGAGVVQLGILGIATLEYSNMNIALIIESTWLAGVVIGAQLVRRWRPATVDSVAVEDAAWRRTQELDEQRRRAEERVRVARELHDVVAHTLAVVGVHLNVAADALDSDPAEARAALRLAQEIRGRAMADLKSLIAVLRDEQAGGIPAPQPDLDGITALVERIRAAGLDVALTEIGDRGAVPAPVGLAAYRVVQEALTNTVQHAGATRATVTIRYTDDDVWVSVTDDGRGLPGGAAPAPHGHGLAGMRERVRALGGRFTAGPGEHGGFAVQATIPVAGP